MTQRGKSKKTTIYDLAELLGVSPTAVSSVLNGNWKKRRISAQLAEKITRAAEEQGYALNKQASLLRSEKSKIIGMIVPKYDNRYFGSIAERFEVMARKRGLFPIITCTQRDPALEIAAARTMLSYQVDWLIATGATDPDKITTLCASLGVPSINLDLPGKLAPSVISDNYAGAKELTRRTLTHCRKRYGTAKPLIFIGGRGTDHNTQERLRGFTDAHRELGLEVDKQQILTCGYAAEKAENALSQWMAQSTTPIYGLFVNSTISLEGVVKWLDASDSSTPHPLIGCFDWDPFVALLDHEIEMVRQDVPAMLDAVFEIIDNNRTAITCQQIMPQII
ncbi:substrate-binding domain-containing protein [Serratia sp. DD3]|uniref:LacI family DNA-binding transcriptional regulator n=1 Tax=Serratia sp. DD3 TaxID=1410619 RepID=UPI0003C52CB9|nr:substrate-binding domain-containing protein [Serratia sp. DD3]KEY56919.1 catabolite repressor/activator [Serratia sp. DD3]